MNLTYYIQAPSSLSSPVSFPRVSHDPCKNPHHSYFACKIAPAATEGATTLPLRPLCGTLASRSPPSKVGTMATAMLVLTILSPVQPRTAQPSYQSSHSAMASNLLSHEQPRKPQNIPQFISHWPHAPAHSRSAKLQQGQLQASLRRVSSQQQQWLRIPQSDRA